MKFKCECGNECNIDGLQTEFYGSGDSYDTNDTARCNCCGKEIKVE